MDLDLDMDTNSDLDEHADTSSDADTNVRGPYTLVYSGALNVKNERSIFVSDF